MVIFADKGRPLKPLIRITLAAFTYLVLELLRTLTEHLIEYTPGFAVQVVIYRLLFTAVAAAVILRLIQLDWRETVAAVLIGNALFIFLYAESWQHFLILWLASAAGVFILPFADKRIKSITATQPRKRWMIAAGFLPAILAVLADILLFTPRSGQAFLGLGTLLSGWFAAMLLIACGSLLSLADKRYWGIMLGGSGLFTALYAYLFWIAFGQPWFP